MKIEKLKINFEKSKINFEILKFNFEILKYFLWFIKIELSSLPGNLAGFSPILPFSTVSPL